MGGLRQRGLVGLSAVCQNFSYCLSSCHPKANIEGQCLWVVLYNLYSQKRTSCSVSSPFPAQYQTLLGYRAEQFQSLSLKSSEYADGVRQVQDSRTQRCGHAHGGQRSRQPVARKATHRGAAGSGEELLPKHLLKEHVVGGRDSGMGNISV